jgi:hypothetical protein
VGLLGGNRFQIDGATEFGMSINARVVKDPSYTCTMTTAYLKLALLSNIRVCQLPNRVIKSF